MKWLDQAKRLTLQLQIIMVESGLMDYFAFSPNRSNHD